MSWNEYHPKEDMEDFLDYLASTYNFVTLETIGDSYEGETMRVAKVRFVDNHKENNDVLCKLLQILFLLNLDVRSFSGDCQFFK